MKHTLAVLLVLVTCFAMGTMPCLVRPQFIVKTAPSGLPAPGSTVTFRVTLDQVVSGTQAVTISSTTPSQFASLPSVLYISDGESTGSFQATLTTSALGTVSVQASCNGYTVSCETGVESY